MDKFGKKMSVNLDTQISQKPVFFAPHNLTILVGPIQKKFLSLCAAYF